MFPNAEKLAGTVVSLPIHPFLTKEEVEYISDNLHAVLGR
jgi:dTDP-4-amino-4,6-dideoxygalactose transaminase